MYLSYDKMILKQESYWFRCSKIKTFWCFLGHSRGMTIIDSVDEYTYIAAIQPAQSVWDNLLIKSASTTIKLF